MKQITITIIFSIIASITLFAQEPVEKKNYNLRDGIALQGYGPVAYFEQNKAVIGNKYPNCPWDKLVIFILYNNQIKFEMHPSGNNLKRN